MSATLCRVRSLDEATAILADSGADALVLAGGQSLLAMISAGLAAPDLLVDLNGVPGAAAWTRDRDALTLGPCVRHRDLEDGRAAGHDEIPLLEPAARQIAHAAVRNRGTFAGSLAHADPAAEWPAVAVAVDASIRLVSSAGERILPASEFFVGPMTTSRRPDELIASVTIPFSPALTGGAVCELSYRVGDYAVVGAAAQLTRDAGAGVVDARVVLFGVDATPLRVPSAEQLVVDGGAEAFADAGEAAAAAASPIDDATASASYRRAMIPVIVRRALHQAWTDSSPADIPVVHSP